MNLKFSKLNFYLSYVFYKVFMFREVKVGTFGLYKAEVIWLISKFYKSLKVENFRYLSYVETNFGKFHIIPDLLTNIAASPAYERLDIDYLLKSIENDAKNNLKILFVDVGAYFGLYTIAVSNSQNKKNNIHFLIFEPGTEYLSESTVDILKKISG